jgi:hypothetical protein
VQDLVRKSPANAQWISYGNYFQGLPFYTRTRVVVVAGTGELEYGRARLPEAGRWFAEEPAALGAMAERLQAEDPSRPVLVMAKASQWQALNADEKARWVGVAASPAAVVLRRR